MRYIVMHKVDANMERGDPPRPGVIEDMGKLVQESAASGVFKDGAGLHRSAHRVRVAFRGGQRRVTRGPYAGENELCASFAMVKAPSLDDAVEQAARFAAVLGDVDIEIGTVVEPWDLGLVKKPEGQRFGRFLLLMKSTPETESGAPRAPATERALEQLLERLRSERVLLARERLAPSARGSRLRAGPDGKRTWVDGPFTESKELIAGFSILELPTREAAIAWAERYAAILLDNEVDVRELV
jgi:hypothetical protein